MTESVKFEYYCYRCGAINSLDLPSPKAPDYHHTDLKCSSCGDGTRLMISSCPNESCTHYVYWINDLSIPDLVKSFAKYMTTNMQALIDKAAIQGARLSIVLTYLGATAICRIPMTIFEASFLGVNFSIMRYLVSLPLIVITYILMEKLVGKKYMEKNNLMDSLDA